MKLFRKREKAQPLSKDELAKHKMRTTEIGSEIEKGEFLSAYEMAVECIKDFKKNDLYGEAYCHYLAGKALLSQHLKNMSPADIVKVSMLWPEYGKIKEHLDRALESYDFLAWRVRARNVDFERICRLQTAIVLIDLALLESLVRKWGVAMESAEKSVDICKKYSFRDGTVLATRMLLNLKSKQLLSVVTEWMSSRRSEK
jgi:hypothetical protein